MPKKLARVLSPTDSQHTHINNSTHLWISDSYGRCYWLGRFEISCASRNFETRPTTNPGDRFTMVPREIWEWESHWEPKHSIVFLASKTSEFCRVMMEKPSSRFQMLVQSVHLVFFWIQLHSKIEIERSRWGNTGMIGCDAKLLDEFAGSNKTAESQDSQVFSCFFSLICSYEFISGVSGWGSSKKPTFFFFCTLPCCTRRLVILDAWMKWCTAHWLVDWKDELQLFLCSGFVLLNVCL